MAVLQKEGGRGRLESDNGGQLEHARALMGGVGSACSNLLKAIHMLGKVFENCNKKSSE